jgi:hypothetical protein
MNEDERPAQTAFSFVQPDLVPTTRRCLHPRTLKREFQPMRKLLLIAGLVAAVGAPAYTSFAPTAAEAQTRCERTRSTNRAIGTVGGGILGALAGSAIDGGRNNTAGLIVGGAAGAYAGNQLAKGKPCPRGYVRRSYTPARAVASNNCTWRDQAYRDAYGNVTHRQVQVCR